jgi:hypothetical protein
VRQARWMALLSDFDFEIKHIKRNEIRVDDALSRSMKLVHLAVVSASESNIKERVKTTQEIDAFFKTVTSYLKKYPTGMKYGGYHMLNDGMLTYKGRLYIQNWDDLKRFIMDELHKRPYIGHPSYQKIITATRKLFYWRGLKNGIDNYLAKCLEFHQVKVEHQNPTWFLHPLPIPEWKWETISMDFITRLPRSTKQNDVIMVVMEKLSKDVQFIPIKSTYKEIDIANIFMK